MGIAGTLLSSTYLTQHSNLVNAINFLKKLQNQTSGTSALISDVVLAIQLVKFVSDEEGWPIFIKGLRARGTEIMMTWKDLKQQSWLSITQLKPKNLRGVTITFRTINSTT